MQRYSMTTFTRIYVQRRAQGPFPENLTSGDAGKHEAISMRLPKSRALSLIHSPSRRLEWKSLVRSLASLNDGSSFCQKLLLLRNAPGAPRGLLLLTQPSTPIWYRANHPDSRAACHIHIIDGCGRFV